MACAASTSWLLQKRPEGAERGGTHASTSRWYVMTTVVVDIGTMPMPDTEGGTSTPAIITPQQRREVDRPMSAVVRPQHNLETVFAGYLIQKHIPCNIKCVLWWFLIVTLTIAIFCVCASENYNKIRWFLTKLQRRICWLLFYGPRCTFRLESYRSRTYLR